MSKENLGAFGSTLHKMCFDSWRRCVPNQPTRRDGRVSHVAAAVQRLCAAGPEAGCGVTLDAQWTCRSQCIDTAGRSSVEDDERAG